MDAVRAKYYAIQEKKRRQIEIANQVVEAIGVFAEARNAAAYQAPAPVYYDPPLLGDDYTAQSEESGVTENAYQRHMRLYGGGQGGGRSYRQYDNAYRRHMRTR